MHCELPDDLAWTTLLSAREQLASGDRALTFVRRNGAWSCDAGPAPDLAGAHDVVALPGADGLAAANDPRVPQSICRTPPDGPPTFEHPDRRPADSGFLTMLEVYAPVLRGAARARERGESFVVGHLTQTLDGRIACMGGEPQWFGNDADRRHAHRMRALLDAVMVGASTALADDPQLTVRVVPGRNPRRVVVSGSGRVLQSERDLKLFAEHGCDVVVAGGAERARGGARVVAVPSASQELAPRDILAALRERGVHSVYLEGGAQTLSSFLQAGCLDLLQVHISPVVLGSGLLGFRLPERTSLADAFAFTVHHATLAGHVLLSCWPRARRHGA